MTYYTHTNGLPANQTRALAGQVRDELDKIDQSFATIPPSVSLYSGSANYGAENGAANAYVLSVSAQVTALADGMTFAFRASNANTGASTINVNSLGALPIVRPDRSALQANDILAGEICEVVFNAAASSFQLAYSVVNAGTQVINVTQCPDFLLQARGIT